MEVEMKIGLEFWTDEGAASRLRETIRRDLAVALYTEGQSPTGPEKWEESYGKVVMVEGPDGFPIPSHKDCPLEEADHIKVTLSRPARAHNGGKP